MSETPNLHKLGETAKANYDAYKTWQNKKVSAEHRQEDDMFTQADMTDANKRWGRKHFSQWTAQQMRDNNNILEKDVEVFTEQRDTALANGREFATQNAANLHDLAVIEAHLAGVAINVEQPLEIGHAIEVHTPKHL